jgi:deoxyribodipyrimidine photolyase-related protein
MPEIRNLILVLGDQLNHDSAALEGFDESLDRVWMAENDGEAKHVWCHKYRLVAFFSPMRHFRDELEARGFEVIYHQLSTDGRRARGSSFASLLKNTLRKHDVERLIVVQPGDARVADSLTAAADDAGIPIEVREDRHFYCDTERFREWAEGRKSMVLEQFYRLMRKEHDVLMDENGEPIGGQWNYDKENRGTFGRQGPEEIPPVPPFEPDAVTREVIELVEARFSEHPGETSGFDLPVNRQQALEYLDDFVTHRLANFGDYQDAMWSEQRFLYHSRLSHALNLHLLNPREVVAAAIAAYQEDLAPLNSVEGFVRQVLGWREYVRGIYWLKMPEYIKGNALECDEDQDVPSFFWDGKTEMACVADAMRLLIQTAYAHHIQRLMVLGLYA